MLTTFDTRLAIGLDPGPVTGIVVLRIEGSRLARVDALQVTPGVVADVLGELLHGLNALVQVERFVVGNRSGRSGTAADGETTRSLVGVLSAVAEREGAVVRQRSAADVKPWAGDLRLAKAGLLEPTKGMRHARDAGKHAIYAATHEGWLPDPLSKEFT